MPLIAKQHMTSMAIQLELPSGMIDAGGQVFKLAIGNNFVQGRRTDVVSAVCLYTACRQASNCKVMLIDFADRVQVCYVLSPLPMILLTNLRPKVNVFKLGRTYKALHATISLQNQSLHRVTPEDLMWRFASKLDFGKDCNKIAEDAVRMAQRMAMDWMLAGRRPSGVCGACIILAARMNNYRRSITEVVYIVKVTTHTIQKRLDEFKMTPSSTLTVDEFLNNEFLESAHDPPSFYEKTEEFQKNKKRRKRRRGHDGVEGTGQDNDEPEELEGDSQGNKRQKTGATPNPDQALPTVELRRDADGFAIPPPPIQTSAQPEKAAPAPAGESDRPPVEADLVDDILADHTETSFRKLVENFADSEGFVGTETEDSSAGTTIGASQRRLIHVPAQWQRDEEVLVNEMSEIISDPAAMEHAAQYAAAEKRVAKHMALAMLSQKAIPSAEVVGEEEFADDVEVQNFLLSPEESAKKEIMWINQNRGWLREQQMKAYKKKKEAQGPAKARRIRKKKPRFGEGQTSAASTPGEAVASVMKQRNFSSKFNYSAFTAMFEEGNDPGLGSAATSRVASRAGSVLGDSAGASTSPSVSGSAPATPAANADTEMGDADDYVDDPDDYIDPDAEGSVQGSTRAESVDDNAEPWKARNPDDEDLPEEDTEFGFGEENHPFDDEDGAFNGPEDYDDE